MLTPENLHLIPPYLPPLSPTRLVQNNPPQHFSTGFLHNAPTQHSTAIVHRLILILVRRPPLDTSYLSASF